MIFNNEMRHNEMRNNEMNAHPPKPCKAMSRSRPQPINPLKNPRHFDGFLKYFGR